MAVRSVEDVKGSARQDVGRYAPVNGLQLYYEIHGQGRPLVLLHGGGSSIETTFGRIRSALAEHHRVVDVVRPEHAVALSRLLPRARLCIVPGGHGEAIGEITWPDADGAVLRLVTTLIQDFLAS